MGAGIGAAIPAGGPLVGFGIGAAVGGVMMIPAGDGKTVGDRIADGGEAMWNWGKDRCGDVANFGKDLWKSVFG